MDLRRAAATLATGVALSLGLTAIAAAAPGDTIYTGTTAEDVPVKLTVAEFGNATAFKIGKTTVTCREGGELKNRSGTYRDFDTSDPGEFSDKRSSSSENGGYHFKTKSTVHGEVAADNETWSGTFKLVTKVFERGDRIDVCKLRTTWSTS
jgi:hypothetical protein